MIVGRDFEWGDDLPFVAANTVGGADLPFPLDIDDVEELRREHKAALARKRPAGFTAVWPEDQAEQRPRLRLA